MEEWEKKLNQILQGSIPPPPPPIPAPVAPSSAPKIPAPAPYNGTSEDISPAINHIHQYAAILIGQYSNMRLGDLVHRVLILLQHSLTTQWVDEVWLRYFNSTDTNALMTLFLEFKQEFGDRMKQEKAREWITLCKQGRSNVSEYLRNFKHQARLAGYKDLNPLIATFCSEMNARLVEDVIRNGGLRSTVFDNFITLAVKQEMTLEAQDCLFPRKPAHQPQTLLQPSTSTATAPPPSSSTRQSAWRSYPDPTISEAIKKDQELLLLLKKPFKKLDSVTNRRAQLIDHGYCPSCRQYLKYADKCKNKTKLKVTQHI
ncbi:hypothetical protein AX16_008989 [Volvariella volvacea WC 439]|nr:hypothetical protein AX16_008989 [Volvariella volvacea WC 439]